jgi:ABC-type uncharacterized transport system auxiliary subunit
MTAAARRRGTRGDDRVAVIDGGRRRFSGAAALLALGLGGCALTRSPPTKEVYLLEPTLPPPVATPKPVSVRIGTVNVAAPFAGRNFVYRTKPLQYETDYYVEFLVAPSAMFSELTGRALRAARVFARVVPQVSGANADYILGGFVSALYADGEGDGPIAAKLAISYFLTPEGGDNVMPVWSNAYRQHVPVATRTSAAYAAALNQAFTAILAALVRDLAAADLKPAAAG